MTIECIFCGLEVERNDSLIHHIGNHHRIKEGLNFLLAGCLMQKEEREEMTGIFQALIESLVSFPAADVSQEFGKATEIFGETCKRKPEEEKTSEDMTSVMEHVSVEKSKIQKKERPYNRIKRLTCTLCIFKCHTKRALLKHNELIHANNHGKVEVVSSEAIFSSLTEENGITEKTKNPVHQNGSINCDRCNAKFSTKRVFNKHVQKMHRITDVNHTFSLSPLTEKRKEKCNRFQNEGSKSSNLPTLESPDGWKCKNCSIIFKSRRCYLRHKKVCVGKFVEMFKTTDYFRNHPNIVEFWNRADENSLENDPTLPKGWKVKYGRRNSKNGKGGAEFKQFYKPGHNFLLRSYIGVIEFVKFFEKRASLERQLKKIKKDKLKVRETRNRFNGKLNEDSDLPDYFKNHPSLIYRWHGDEATLVDEPKLTGGWKIKLEMRKKGSSRKQFVTPDRKYVIRTIEGVLEYLQHNDVKDDDIETLLETLLQMKNLKSEIKTPHMLNDDVSKNSNGSKQVKYSKKIVSITTTENRVRRTQDKFTKDDLHHYKLMLENQECCESKFKLEDWGFECKDKIRRLGKNIGKFETDPKLPSGWTVRYHGRNSKSSSKDFVTPDKKYYVRTYNAVIKYMRLSGDYSDYLIRETADSLGVKLEEIEMANFKINNPESCKEMVTDFDLRNNKDSVEEMVAKMDDEKLLKEVEDEINSSGEH